MQPLWIQFERLSSLSILCICRSRSRLVRHSVRQVFFRGRLTRCPKGNGFSSESEAFRTRHEVPSKIRTREETYTTWSRSMCTAAHGDGSDRWRKRQNSGPLLIQGWKHHITQSSFEFLTSLISSKVESSLPLSVLKVESIFSRMDSLLMILWQRRTKQEWNMSDETSLKTITEVNMEL